MKIFNLKSLTFVVLLLIAVSCSKDKEIVPEKEKEEEVVVPKMDYKMINHITTYGNDPSIYVSFLNQNLRVDFGAVYIKGKMIIENLNFYFSSPTFFQLGTNKSIGNNMEQEFIKPLDFGSIIDTTESVWITKGGEIRTTQTLYNSMNLPVGVNLEEDLYVAIRTKTNSSPDTYKYGWLSFKISTDRKTVEIKEVALSQEENVVVKVGSK
ncbi:MAG TPA: hypothetical protein VLZ75_06555 [Chitinophagales bacterium]|nr:hypothetical protein [Chitinophagales bacterium]